MTGFEYTAAVGMLYEGMVDEGLEVIGDVRERYDGLRRNPFDEAECGHHYVRAMAVWGAVPALTGFGYDAVRKRLRFAASDRPVRWFWASGDAWGTIRQTPADGGVGVELAVYEGAVPVRVLELTGAGGVDLGEQTIRAGETWRGTVPAS